MNEEVPRARRQRENNTVPQLPCLCILKAPNTSTLSTGRRENQGASLLFPSQQAQWGTLKGVLCVRQQGMVPTHTWPSQPPPTPCYQALASWALESIGSAPQDDLTPKFSSSSPSPLHTHQPWGCTQPMGTHPISTQRLQATGVVKKEHAQFRKLPQLLIQNKI